MKNYGNRSMKRYLVSWSIDLNAEDAKDAALQAHGAAFDPGTAATIWIVEDIDTGARTVLDLEDLEDIQVVA